MFICSSKCRSFSAFLLLHNLRIVPLGNYHLHPPLQEDLPPGKLLHRREKWCLSVPWRPLRIELPVPCTLDPAQPGSGAVFISTGDLGHQNLNHGLCVCTACATWQYLKPDLKPAVQVVDKASPCLLYVICRKTGRMTIL